MEDPGQIAVNLTVNGVARAVGVEPRTLLVDMLRDSLELTGTKVGCESGVCGACTVLMDGAAVKSCTLLAAQAEGADVSTVESLSPDGRLNELQDGFQQAHGVQCGFCTPGMLMALTALLRRSPSPGEPEIREALDGNLCRCTGYQNVIHAVEYAVDKANSPIKMVADTPGKRFYQRQVEALLARDPDRLVNDNYHADAQLMSPDWVFKGHDALREHFRQFMNWMIITEIVSTDKFNETENSVMFEATINTNQGQVRIYDAFLLDGDKARYHFTGVR